MALAVPRNLEQRVASYRTWQTRVRRSLSIVVEDDLDPETWSDLPNPIRFAIRATRAVRSLGRLFVAGTPLRDRPARLGQFLRGPEPSMLQLEVDLLTNQDLWNLSGYLDAIAAYDLLCGRRPRAELLERGSRIHDLRCRRADLRRKDSEVDSAVLAHELIRRAARGDTVFLRDATSADDDLPQSEVSIAQSIAITCRLLGQLDLSPLDSSVPFGVETGFALVRLGWFDSQVAGTADLSVDRLLLLSHAVTSLLPTDDARSPLERLSLLSLKSDLATLLRARLG